MKHIVFDFYESCPECGKEADGFCNENLAGICNHCGSEITIRNQCPVTCGCKQNREDEEYQGYCEYCPYRFLDCNKVDCSNCIAKMEKTVEKADDGYEYISVSDKSLMLKGKDE